MGGDPVNKNDPLGLCSPDDDPPCYSVTGTDSGDDGNSDDEGEGWDDASDAGNADPGVGVQSYMTPFPSLQKGGKGGAGKITVIVNRYLLGLNSLKTFTTLSSKCLTDLKNVGLTPADVDSLAS